MEQWQELYEQAEAKSTAALELDDLEKVKELNVKAEELFELAEAKKAAAVLKAKIKEPQMLADLPVTPDPNEPPEPTQKSFNPAYVLRYGDEDDAVKAILKDLYGDGYQEKRWGQWQSFAKYLRTGEGQSVGHIFTPEEIKVALKEGQDIRALKTVMVEASDVLGGYVVPADWRADVIMRLLGLTCVRPRARVLTTSRDAVELPKITGGDTSHQYIGAVRVTWVDETPLAATADTNVTFGLERIPVHTVMAKTRLSRNLVEDAAFNIVSHLAVEFAGAMAIDEDNQFLTGDGNGTPKGFFPSETSNVMGLEESVSSHATALTSDGLIELVYDLPSQYRQNAVFVANRATWKAVRKLKTGDGEYLWERNWQVGQPDRLLGHEVLEQEIMPDIGAGKYPILFGDFGQGYTIVDRIGMSVERYLDSKTAELNQILYLCRRRLGGQCVATWAMVAHKVSE